LIAYDEEIVDSETQVHPLMQDRKFVLLPIQDLNLDWKHVFEKSISKLVDISSDQSVCEAIETVKTIAKYCIGTIQLC
jgi:7,8-dihydro-6-hydroxymethylpterin-pyrophosphokinase